MLKQSPVSVLLASLFLLSACAEPDGNHPAMEARSAFWSALLEHCGKAYAGRLVSNDAVDADFADAEMVMHVSECTDRRIAIPFHVAIDGEWDRSRTWVITRRESGLRLKHDHRHEDGSSDAVTMYGGDSDTNGSAEAQFFPVDAESVALFEREGLGASVTNTWSLELTEKGVFAYQMYRTKAGGAPEDRLFRVEFDLREPVEPPPAAWGWK